MKTKNGFELQEVCGEHLLIPAGVENVDFSKIISFNETAAYLWKNVEGRDYFDIDTLVELLTKEYDVEREVALEDCRLISECWAEAGIIEE